MRPGEPSCVPAVDDRETTDPGRRYVALVLGCLLHHPQPPSPDHVMPAPHPLVAAMPAELLGRSNATSTDPSAARDPTLLIRRLRR